jgi:hypothetical protein
MKTTKLNAFIILALASLALSSIAQAGQTPPPPPASQNTWYGYQALFNDTTGDDNDALGFKALYSNIDGFSNHALGDQALYSNTSGGRNVAVGGSSLFYNTTGDSNTGTGNVTLFLNTTGSWNTATGRRALFLNETGNLNIGLGYSGGYFTSGDNNIDIGNVGVDGESNTIRIGQLVPVVPNAPDGVLLPPHTATFIAGIFGAATSLGVPVYVDANGKLGTTPSSQKFKQDIKSMDKASEAVLALRPVTFHYKKDSKSTPQFGLVAEEVAKVNPDLVARDGKGEIYSVRYEAVNAMLLNEFLKEHRRVEELEKQVEKLTAGLQKVSERVELSQPAPHVVDNR